VAASLESKPWIAPPLRHNEMPARTYSASNFGSITPLANQMTVLNQSANSKCPNSWMLFGGRDFSPVYVRCGSSSVIAAMSTARPLFHRKRKSIRDLAMSHKCQQRL